MYINIYILFLKEAKEIVLIAEEIQLGTEDSLNHLNYDKKNYIYDLFII